VAEYELPAFKIIEVQPGRRIFPSLKDALPAILGVFTVRVSEVRYTNGTLVVRLTENVPPIVKVIVTDGAA
jgi:hypothetical protein